MVEWHMQEDEAPDVKRIIDACRNMQADAVALEMEDRTIVVAMNAYDGTYAMTCCDPCANLPTVARGLQLRLYSEPSRDGQAAYLPAATVRSVLLEWERQIALVFGERYASGLINGALGTTAPGEMMPDDLDRIRLQLSSATGGCLDLQKVDK
jgi:hypothetical protein